MVIELPSELEARLEAELARRAISSPAEWVRQALEREESGPMVLSAEGSRAFVDSLLNPPPQNDRLKQAAAEYRKLTGL